MTLFFSQRINDNYIYLVDEEHIHCIKSLRAKVDDTIFITDGLGHLYETRVKQIDRNQTLCLITNVTTQLNNDFDFSIAIAPTKNLSRLEWFVEKAVEIGISSIYIINTKRTEKKLLNTTRLKKIMISALKQSQQCKLPELELYQDFNSFLAVNALNHKDLYIAHCISTSKSLLTSKVVSKASSIVCIGPEGDFTEDEVGNAVDVGFKEVSLGKTRLRTETAGLVALMMLHSKTFD